MSTEIILAGNTMGATVTFSPKDGVPVLLENVTAWSYEHKTHTKTPLTPVQVGVNQFYVEVPTPDAAVGGVWTVRFECSAPKMAEEETWLVEPSVVSNP